MKSIPRVTSVVSSMDRLLSEWAATERRRTGTSPTTPSRNAVLLGPFSPQLCGSEKPRINLPRRQRRGCGVIVDVEKNCCSTVVTPRKVSVHSWREVRRIVMSPPPSRLVVVLATNTYLEKITVKPTTTPVFSRRCRVGYQNMAAFHTTVVWPLLPSGDGHFCLQSPG